MVKEKLNISLTTQEKKQLQRLCEFELRKCSAQIVHMMNYYIEHSHPYNKNSHLHKKS